MPAAPPARRSRRQRPRPRGAALLIVMVAIAVLTALAVDLAYDTRVRLQIAANGRDELRATYLARSAVSLSRLVLTFQQQIDQASQAACGSLAQLAALGGQGQRAGATGATQASTTAAACPRPQIWSVIPVSSGLVQALFGGPAPGAERAPPPPARREAGAPPPAAFGDFEGGFDARIEDEGRKVNAQLDALGTSGVLGPQVEALLRLSCDARWDPLFDREDAAGQRWSRTDLLLHLKDWVDEDQVSSALTVSFPAGNCSFLVPANPFEQGFADENTPYDRGPDRYKAKNARLDSLEELSLVAGVTDAFMAAFGDRLTVYLPRDAAINVNATDPLEQLRIAALMADPAAQPLLLDPTFPEKLSRALSDARMGGLLSVTPLQFAGLVQALGVPVRREYATQNPKSPFTDRSVVYRIRATGSVGAVTKTLEAVITFDPNQNQPAPGQAATATATQAAAIAAAAATAGAPAQLQAAVQAQAAAQGGRLIHWREE
jgi:general secretion pathway protein K